MTMTSFVLELLRSMIFKKRVIYLFCFWLWWVFGAALELFSSCGERGCSGAVLGFSLLWLLSWRTGSRALRLQ